MEVVVITGASRGIGAAIARKFATMGEKYKLFLLAQNAHELQKVADDCQQFGAEAHFLTCDVTDATQVAQCAQQVLRQGGAPEIVINNAGLYAPSTFTTITPDEFKKQIDINLTSAFLVTHAFLPSMLARRRGDIFFMGSIASLSGYENSLAYTAAKHGLLGLARGLRLETEGQGLRVMTLLPGAVKTPAWDGVNVPEERFIPPNDIANIIFDVHQLDLRTNLDEILVRPQSGDI